MSEYCKVCASPDRSEIDRHFSHGESARAISRWTESIGRPITHPTLTKHWKHAVSPEAADLLVHRNGEKPSLPTIRPVSSTEFLEQVVSEGARQVQENPNKVKLDHALRAAVALERKKEDGRGQMRVLVLSLMGHTPPVTIEGSYKELEGST